MNYGAQNAAPTAERQITLNDRLNKAVETVTYQCDRLEAVLARVNGTPTKIDSASALKTAAPRVSMSMQSAMDSLEGSINRLVELASGVERVA